MEDENKVKYYQEYYQNNKEKFIAKARLWKKENKNKVRESTLRYREKDSYKESLKRRAERRRTFEGREARRLYAVKHRTNVTVRLKDRIRSRLSKALKLGNKSSSFTRALGISIEEFKLYIENQFYDRLDGTKMTWKNIGEWHLDHVIPLSKLDLEDPMEFKEACDWLNYQPLWKEDNFKKSNKLPL